jgi:hypothetical protein
VNSADNVISMLNQLLGAEQCNLAPRLVQSEVFVSGMSVRASEVVHRMADTTRRNCEQLVDLIIDLGGEPRPRPCDVSAANLHYQELSYVLPQLVQAHEKLVRQYNEARPRLAGSQAASGLVSKILSHHESDLSSLKEQASHPVAAS